MQPGEYFSWAHGNQFVTRPQRVRLASDTTTAVHLSTSVACLVNVRAPHPETGRFERRRLEVLGATRELEHRQQYGTDSHALPRLSQSVRLAPGSYRIRIESSSGWNGECEVVVPSETESIDIDLELMGPR